MERIRHGYQHGLIKDAISLLPIKVKPYLEKVDFVFDYTPSYIGSHFDGGFDKYGRSYMSVCHCSFRHHTSDERTTIFLFNRNIEKYESTIDIIWHEIAHAIHERLNFARCEWTPITDYEIQNSKWIGLV